MADQDTDFNPLKAITGWFAPQQQPNPYGLDDAMVKQARVNALGNIGATLLAAAQPGPLGQRGQIMSQLPQSMDVSGQLNQAQQMMLRNVQMQAAQRAIARDRSRDDALKNPQLVAELEQNLGMKLTPSVLQALGPDFLDKAIAARMSKDPFDSALKGLTLQEKAMMIEMMKRFTTDQNNPVSNSLTNGPSVGQVVNGWKFKGGNPNDQASWEKP